MPQLTEQVAVIAGGAGGLGRALGAELARQGVQVILVDLDGPRAGKAAAAIAGRAEGMAMDATDHDSCARVVQSIVDRWGRIDIFVNAAGITGKTGIPSHQVELADFDRVMAINVRSCLVTTRLVVPVMLKRGYGRILHVASIAGKEGNAGMVAYSASKAAVIGLTKTQGKEYADSGVTVNAIAPAVIFTDLHDNMPAEQIKYMTSKIPMQRCGTLEEFAKMAAFIVSPAASFTTGFTFDLSGGRATY